MCSSDLFPSHDNGFDIGSKNVFSAKCGEFLPVFWDLGIPGCTYDIDIQYFTRTRPVQTLLILASVSILIFMLFLLI